MSYTISLKDLSSFRKSDTIYRYNGSGAVDAGSTWLNMLVLVSGKTAHIADSMKGENMIETLIIISVVSGAAATILQALGGGRK
ncbi:hypothetical protein FACS1894140_4970 [Spirochaetia bacterium]|nr:hypothetical protein FACS1894140_4970 [Spirochaetia bacterium]